MWASLAGAYQSLKVGEYYLGNAILEGERSYIVMRRMMAHYNLGGGAAHGVRVASAVLPFALRNPSDLTGRNVQNQNDWAEWSVGTFVACPGWG